MIDEALGCIDETKFENIEGVLEYMRKIYKKIIIISHDNIKIRPIYENEITIRRENGTSKLII